MTTRSPLATASAAALLRTLLDAAGVGLVATAAVAGVACGGKVVVDEPSGSGGSGGTTTGTTTATLTDLSSCTAPAPVFGPSQQCLPGTAQSCPPIGAPGLEGELLAQMQLQTCGTAELSSVICGPAMMSGQCCYLVDGYTQLCGGRPYVVDGAARVAMVEARADWLSAAHRPAGVTDPASRATLAALWTRHALDEHAAVASFARFTLELLSVSAPADLVQAAQRAIGDEIRHAELCFALASGYLGGATGPGALPLAGAAPSRPGLAEIAAAAAREGCVGETLAAYEAAVTRDAAADPAVRAALDEIARDEAEHAALAFRFVAWALRRGDASVRAAVARAFAETRALPAVAADEGDPAVLRAHGRLPAPERRELAARCLSEIITPAARALLAEVDAAPAAIARA